MQYDMILVRYGEMTLKKDNYKFFYKKMVDNIKKRLLKYPLLKIEAQPYRLYIYLNGEDSSKVLQELRYISGLHSYSLSCKAPKKIDAIVNLGSKMVNEYVIENDIKDFSFKVETKRSDKTYPLTSLEITKEVSSALLPLIGCKKVDVHNPDVIMNIDFRFDGAFIYINEVKGLGGYPNDSQGKALVMMSGGIDSPVSAFLSMKKGINISAIHFFSPPYTTLASLQKVIDLLKILSKYSYNEEIFLYIAYFREIQDEIKGKANNDYLVTLLRRAMYTVATKVCENDGFDAIINGESIGQVASQTLESIKVINEVTNYPILRPLSSFDKEDIIKISKQIETYDISIRPYEDCCTVFVPKHPVIRPKISDVKKEEEKTNLKEIIEKCVFDIKKIKITPFSNINAYDLDNDNKYDI